MNPTPPLAEQISQYRSVLIDTGDPVKASLAISSLHPGWNHVEISWGRDHIDMSVNGKRLIPDRGRANDTNH